MTLEEKQLLLKDLCLRLPYGVKGLHRGQVHELFTIDGREANNACIQVDGYDAWFSVDTFKPYLRPISSVTQEEFYKLEEYSGLIYDQLNLASFQNGTYKCLDFYLTEIPADVVILVFDWLNKHHFDYRGLIERDFALEAKEEMYKTE